MSSEAQKKVIVYTTPTCPYCKMAKEYLAKKGISYLERDVAEDSKTAREMIKKSGQMGDKGGEVKKQSGRPLGFKG